MDENKENDLIEKKTIKETTKDLLKGGKKVKTLVIRHDAPKLVLPIYEPVKFSADGVIDSPARYLEKRVGLIDQKATTVLIDRDAMSIALHSNETDHYGDKVTGKLTVHPDFKKFNINQMVDVSPEALGNFLKMNRFVFKNKVEGMALVAKLKNFTAGVNATVEEKSANNGDKKSLREQIVNHNLPPAFKINIGLFKGQPAKEIEVEIVINPNTLDCRLESPEAQEFMDDVKNTVIDEQIEAIKTIAPDVLIIEK